ncbi:uncharacterized protein CLUP02_08827 [Colletotrichum lupini]|uniref:Uncharacterized protein n=1 Tax=Colletotrichum lupini TaxID=145971 RepID=A0A9Q8WHU3_9PEZI|nr:uncharacterized protein CLUP02_08827 [Colletotrichum lupini]UQC83332.1 hypothetical protein CLUP02_08827 [Colletotrichum lupini]
MLALHYPDLIPGYGTNCYQKITLSNVRSRPAIGIGDGMLRYLSRYARSAAQRRILKEHLGFLLLTRSQLRRVTDAATDAPEGLERMRRSELPRG